MDQVSCLRAPLDLNSGRVILINAEPLNRMIHSKFDMRLLVRVCRRFLEKFENLEPGTLQTPESFPFDGPPSCGHECTQIFCANKTRDIARRPTGECSFMMLSRSRQECNGKAHLPVFQSLSLAVSGTCIVYIPWYQGERCV